MRRYPYAHIALTVVTLATLAPDAPGEGSSTGIFGRHRLIRRFDFEEAAHNNFEDLPKHWYVIGRPADTSNPNFMQHPLHAELITAANFPGYTQVRFDKPQHEPGNHSLYFGLNGGNAGAFIEIGTLPAIPTSDYLITASIRTENLTQAGTMLSAYFIDNNGNRIEKSIATSPMIRTGGDWQDVAVKLHGEFSDAAWIGLQIQLRQPDFDPDSPLGDRQVIYRQVTGSAWIDDVSIWQMPRVTVSSQTPVNIIRAPAKPRLTMQVRDLTGRVLNCEVLLLDHQLRRVASHTHALGEGAPIKWNWDPPLDRFGWYLVQLNVSEPGTAGRPPAMIARTLSALLWLPAEPALYPDDVNRFAISADDVQERYLDLLPELLDRIDVHSTVVSIWASTTQRDQVVERQERMDSLIQNILGHGWHIGLSLNPLPKELADELDLDTNNPLLALSKPQEKWLAYLSPALLRHGQRINHWHLGAPKYSQAFYIKNLSPLIHELNDVFQNIAPNPKLIVPWKISQSRLDQDMGTDYFSLNVPIGVAPDTIKIHTDEWRQSPPARFDLNLEVLPATTVAHEQRIQDLILRMLYGWEADANALVISRPWTRAAGRQTALLPDPLLGVFSQVAHRIAGRRIVGNLPAGRGLKCLIFKSARGGMLAAWNQSADPRDAIIDMYLGKDPQVIDVWGNRYTVPLVDGRHQVQLTTTPVFIENIDAELALFRASFKLEPKFIESTLSPHRRELKLTNPWSRTISGNFLIDNPPTWHVSPKRHHFSIASGQTATLPVDLQFPVYEVAGYKHIAARFDFVANERYLVDISTSMVLGLENVELDATLSIETNPLTGTLDAVVTQLISNTGSDETVALYAFASLQGFPRQERIVAQLKPGQTILRRFRFKDAAQAVQTTPIRVGVRQTTGPAVLNKILSAKDL